MKRFNILQCVHMYGIIHNNIISYNAYWDRRKQYSRNVYKRNNRTLNKVIITNIEFASQAIGVELIMQGIINLNLGNYIVYVYDVR